MNLSGLGWFEWERPQSQGDAPLQVPAQSRVLFSGCGRARQVDPAPKEPKAHPRLCHQMVAQLSQSTIPRGPDRHCMSFLERSCALATGQSPGLQGRTSSMKPDSHSATQVTSASWVRSNMWWNDRWLCRDVK